MMDAMQDLRAEMSAYRLAIELLWVDHLRSRGATVATVEQIHADASALLDTSGDDKSEAQRLFIAKVTGHWDDLWAEIRERVAKPPHQK